MRDGPVITHAVVRTGVLLSLVLSLTAGASAQRTPPAPAPATPPSPSAPAATEPVPALEPKAIDILKASSDRLAAARTVSFTAVAAYESPSRPGPPLLYTTRSTV